MDPKVVIVFVFVVALLALLIGALRTPPEDLREQLAKGAHLRRDRTYSGLARKMRRAGFREIGPGALMVIVGLIAAFLVVLVLLFFRSSPWLLIPAVIAPPVILNLYLSGKERSYLRRCLNEMVPFMRKIEAQVRAGQNVQVAFANAVTDTPLYADILSEQVRSLQLNRPFVDVLHDTLEPLPLRAWYQLIQQIEMYATVGGQLEEILSDSANQLNTLLRLQAEIRADYSRIERQQYALLVIAVISVLGLWSAGMMSTLMSSTIGWVIIGAALAVMAAGVLFGRRQVKDIERRLDF